MRYACPMKKIALVMLISLVGCGAEEEPEGMATESEARVVVRCVAALAGDKYTDANTTKVTADCPNFNGRHALAALDVYAGDATDPETGEYVIPFWSSFEIENRTSKPFPVTVVHSGRPCPQSGASITLYDRYGTGSGNSGCKFVPGEHIYRISVYYGSEARYKERERLDTLPEPLASIEFVLTVSKPE